MNRRRTRISIEIALTIALSAVLSMFLLWPPMLQGGSISLVMLPLFVLAFRRGVIPGVVAGALYGMIDLLINPFVVHWAQLVLDYPAAYLMVGFAGVVRPALKRALTAGSLAKAGLLMGSGVVLGAASRYVVHFLSGMIFFAEYAPEGQPVWLYSAVYNLLYIGPSAAACLAAALVVVPLLSRIAPIETDPVH